MFEDIRYKRWPIYLSVGVAGGLIGALVPMTTFVSFYEMKLVPKLLEDYPRLAKAMPPATVASGGVGATVGVVVARTLYP